VRFQRRAAVSVVSRPATSCVLCDVNDQESVEYRSAAELVEVLAACRTTNDEVTLTGRNGSMHPEIDAIIAAARRCNFAAVGMEVSGAESTLAAALRTLRAAGLTDICVTLCGAHADAHDYHTQSPGSFDRTVGTLRAANGVGLRATVETLLTRSNAQVLDEFPTLLAEAGVSGWCIDVLGSHEGTTEHAARFTSRLGMSLPYALRAIERARRARIPAWIRGAPMCLIGPLAARRLESEPRCRPACCDDCPSRPACPGVDRAYLDRFGSAELRPHDLVARDSGADDVARMFVGP